MLENWIIFLSIGTALLSSLVSLRWSNAYRSAKDEIIKAREAKIELVKAEIELVKTEYGAAKDEIIKVKETEIEFLKLQISLMNEFTSMRLREHFQRVRPEQNVIAAVEAAW